MKKITVNLKEKSYPVVIYDGLRNDLPHHINKYKPGNFGFVITSPKIYDLYKGIIKKSFNQKKFKVIIAANGERAKSKECFFRVIDNILSSKQINNNPFILCLGGGTIGDLGGFIASVYKRGINYIQVPTTLIGQIDSSIGGKTAIDTPQAKNIIGTFYQPKAVLIDPSFLNTLPKKEVREGLAEALKYGIIKDKELFCLLKNNPQKILSLDKKLLNTIIYRCVKIKADIVAKDEKEAKGIRTILNFGHTFAHGLEAASKYKKISHGKAVALGMLYASYLSQQLGRISPALTGQISQALQSLGLPVKIKFEPKKVLNALRHDKKFRAGKIRMVLIDNIGKVSVSTNINQKDLSKTLKKIQAFD